MFIIQVESNKMMLSVYMFSSAYSFTTTCQGPGIMGLYM